MKKVKDARLFEAMKTFLTEYLPNIRALSPHTVQAYKDALNLYLLFIKEKKHKELSQIRFDDFTAENLLKFLQWLEIERKCSVSTRNQRLIAIQVFCKYLFNNVSDFEIGYYTNSQYDITTDNFDSLYIITFPKKLFMI